MTIANETNKSGPYFYNGAATSFAYGFKIDDATHIRVVETVTATGVETDLVLNTHYTVTGVGNDTGSVVIAPARAAGKSVTLVRKLPFTQPIVLENQGAYFAKVVEAAFDRGVARDQQLQEQISRAVLVPISTDPTDLADLVEGVVQLLGIVDEVTTVAAIAPSVVTVAANVTPISVVATNITPVQTVAANIAAVSTVAGISAAVSTVAGVAANVTTVAGIAASVTAVAGVSTAVSTVAANIASVNTAATNIAAIIAAPAAATAAAGSASAAAASAASVNAAIISMSRRRNLSVNGSLLVSAENGSTLGTANGYFYADQKALYRSSDLAGKISVQRVAYTSLAGGSQAGEFKCTAVATLISTSLATDTDFIEGSDPEFVAAGWGAAGAKAIMRRIEVQKPAGTYSVHVTNRAGNRHCWVPYTVSVGEAGVKVPKEVQIPGDTGGTWSKADGEIGATIDDVLVLGSSFVGGTAGVWGASAFYGGAGQKNFLDNTANVARHTDFGMRQDPDNTGVYGAYEVGEVDAVYRAERYLPKVIATSNLSIFGSGQCFSATEAYALIPLLIKPAKPPTGIFVSSGGHFSTFNAGGSPVLMGAATFNSANYTHALINLSGGSGLVAGNATMPYLNTTAGFFHFTGCRLS